MGWNNRRRFGLRSALSFSALLVAFAQAQLAQAQTAPPGSTVPAAPVPAASGSSGGGVVFVILLIGLFAIVGIAVKVFDRRRKRNDQAVQIQARIADALLLDPALVNVPVAATVHLPTWGKGPARIEVRGHVPRPELRDATLELVRREAQASGVAFDIEDHVAVEQAVSAHAA